MMKHTILLALALAVCSSAFAPRAALVTKPSLAGRITTLHMSEPEDAKTKIAQDGTFYDDEIEPDQLGAPKAGISDSMRERLRREASTGLDSEAKQTNVLLYIMGAVGVLVILGGQGILY
mmetsp:Transcript_10445/g.12559  ORF Transcript_10445/g.12559 Transcript_10445/m.12559 type:complete len:120 (-) Transcript_10445:780-1139(-)|eukprot:CAMPEP_0195253626 /NCGR_PEP_ID=MMETSP0706-20130129/4578_1 /TAXON_ID=33640 /ORGANISM="Asterionellopsis glacialis, Strain CCMP134" /LENGTH=119 /DNA_ID=CAMNT_0040306165 /DNA_START=63 /DNA_END=422 /DNA_ORIENTATION=+